VSFASPGEDAGSTTEGKNRLLGKVSELSLSKSERGRKSKGGESTSEMTELEGKLEERISNKRENAVGGTHICAEVAGRRKRKKRGEGNKTETVGG
jgi:hypothetical protein